mgnify:CR=1 FL=1
MTIYTSRELNWVLNAVRAIKDIDCAEYIKHFDDNSTGFMWSTNETVYKLGKALENDGHSGASFACTMRLVQTFLTSNDDIDGTIVNIQNRINNNIVAE